MFLAGDEFGNTQFGNNNAYCQDNIISWLDWNLLQKNNDIFRFFRYMIAFRKNHPAIRTNLEHSGTGYDFMSVHNGGPDNGETTTDTKTLGILYAGYDRKQGKEDIVYICINVFWEPMTIYLPYLPTNFCWKLMINTGMPSQEDSFFDEQNAPEIASEFCMKERSVAVFIGRSKR